MITNKKSQYVSLAELINEGKKVAFVYGNRNISGANLKAKKESMKRFGKNIHPLMYVSGTKALKEQCKLVDPISNALLKIDEEEAKNYIVLLEGQHRYIAACELPDFSLDNLLVFESYCEDASCVELLSESNMETCKWAKLDYVRGSALRSDNAFAKFCAKLVNEGYSYSVISLIVTQKSKDMSPKIFTEIMKDPENFKVEDFKRTKNSDKFTYNLERAERFIKSTTANSALKEYGKHRYLIQAVIDMPNDYRCTMDDVIDAVAYLTEETINRFKKQGDADGIKAKIQKALWQIISTDQETSAA